MGALGKIRPSSWILLTGMVIGYVLAAAMPVSWGWENGVLENFQVLTLLLGCLVAVVAVWLQRGVGASKIWWVAAMCWTVMAARELAWGAVFFPPLGMTAEGPIFSSSVLWWKPAVKWVCGALLALCVYLGLRHRLLSCALLRWWREAAMPWGALLVFFSALVLSAAAEGHAGRWVEVVPAMARLVMEEMAECWAYMALWWAQWQLVLHMQTWHASSDVSTLHFSHSTLGESF